MPQRRQKKAPGGAGLGQESLLWPGCPHLPGTQREFARFSDALATHADRPQAITALEGTGSQVPLRLETSELPLPVTITACDPHKAVKPMIPRVLVKGRRALCPPGMQGQRLVITLPAGIAAMARASRSARTHRNATHDAKTKKVA